MRELHDFETAFIAGGDGVNPCTNDAIGSAWINNVIDFSVGAPAGQGQSMAGTMPAVVVTAAPDDSCGSALSPGGTLVCELENTDWQALGVDAANAAKLIAVTGAALSGNQWAIAAATAAWVDELAENPQLRDYFISLGQQVGGDP